MSDTTQFGFPEAAHRLGVPVRVLRHAIRQGRVPAPAQHQGATTQLTQEWLESVRAAVRAAPGALGHATRQKVPAFARYVGTSAWRKYANRVREYAHHRAAVHAAESKHAA